MPMSAARLASHPQLREALCAAVEGPLAKHEISRGSASVASGPLADSKSVTATAASLHRAVGMPTSGMFEGSSIYICCRISGGTGFQESASFFDGDPPHWGQTG